MSDRSKDLSPLTETIPYPMLHEVERRQCSADLMRASFRNSLGIDREREGTGGVCEPAQRRRREASDQER